MNKHNNPESLKYTLGQKVYWQNESTETVQGGTVINVDFNGVDVTSGTDEYWVPFDKIIHTA